MIAGICYGSPKAGKIHSGAASDACRTRWMLDGGSSLLLQRHRPVQQQQHSTPPSGRTNKTSVDDLAQNPPHQSAQDQPLSSKRISTRSHAGGTVAHPIAMVGANEDHFCLDFDSRELFSTHTNPAAMKAMAKRPHRRGKIRMECQQESCEEHIEGA